MRRLPRLSSCTNAQHRMEWLLCVSTGNDVELVYNTMEDALLHARRGDGPFFIEAMTYRLTGHMMGDPEVYRTKEEVAQARENEPIRRLERRLRSLGTRTQSSPAWKPRLTV